MFAKFRCHPDLVGHPASGEGVIVPAASVGVAAGLGLDDGTHGVPLDVLGPGVLHADRGVQAGQPRLVRASNEGPNEGS